MRYYETLLVIVIIPTITRPRLHFILIGCFRLQNSLLERSNNCFLRSHNSVIIWKLNSLPKHILLGRLVIWQFLSSMIDIYSFNNLIHRFGENSRQNLHEAAKHLLISWCLCNRTMGWVTRLSKYISAAQLAVSIGAFDRDCSMDKTCHLSSDPPLLIRSGIGVR